MEKLDVLIINPSALDKIYQSLNRDFAAIETPIWAGLIANYLRAKDYSVSLLDCEAEHVIADHAAIVVKDLSPKLVVIVVYGQQPSASTQNMLGASKVCDAIKQLVPEQQVIMVGGHVSALPVRTLKEESCDFVCRGEGPYTIQGLLECGGRYDQVPGLGYKTKGGYKVNEMAPTVPQDRLSIEMPGIAYDLMPMGKYRAHNWHCFDNIEERSPYASIYTSLGCPFSCTFCCINAPFGKSSFRYWDPNFIITQFDDMALKYGIKNIKIADEMFVLKEAHFLKICELLKERAYGFNIWAYSRVDTVKPHHLKALKDAGINWLALGIESQSQFVRSGVNKGKFNYQDIKNVVQMIKDAGIHVHGNYIFGLPDDDLMSMNQTLEMAKDLNCEMSNFYSAMAYPGSKLYDLAIDNKWTLPDSWIGYSQHSIETTPLPTNFVAASEVLAFRDQAFQNFYTNEKYLGMVKDKFGVKTLNHIKNMTTIKLERRLLNTSGAW